jgi:tetratricopeptide (TPR) repeat protein
MQETVSLPRFRTIIGIAAGFFLIGLLIYGRSLDNPFVRWDDGMLIYENPAIRQITPATLKWIFTHFDPELYIPVTFFSYQIDYLIGGIHAFQYHLHNLILHTLNALFVAWLIFLMFQRKWVALFCGLAFLVHPLNTEAVEWASGRKDVLSTFFFLGAIVSYLYFRDRDRGWMYGLSIVLFTLGLLSKVMIITLPVILLLIDLQQRRTFDRRMVTDKIPYVALSVMFGLIGILGKQTVIASSTLSAKFLMACKSTVFYIQQFFWPAKLSLLYPYTKTITITSQDFFVPLFLLVAIIGAAILCWRRRRDVSIGIFFYLITVGPTLLNFAKGGDLDVYFGSDRYAYVPQIGILIVICAVIAYVTDTVESSSHRSVLEKGGLATGCALLVLFSGLAYRQSLVWTDTQSLFMNVIRLYPDASHVAYNNLGNMERLNGNLDVAIENYTQAIAIRPHAKTYSNLGAAYRKQKNFTAAMDVYQQALKLDPKSPFAHFGLGIVYASLGKYDQAEIEYVKAAGFDPTYEDVFVNLGALYAAEGRYEDAVTQYKKALEINGLYAAAVYNLAVAEGELGRADDAILSYRRAIGLDPSMIAARINLALLLYNKGETDAAAEQFRAVLKIDPENASAQSALRQMGLQ